jgi:HTH-type transcriptional regulator/antitoxin HigA
LHLRDNKDLKFIDLTDIEENDIENEANIYAQEILIQSDTWNDLLENYTPLNDEKIYEFSNKYRINPAIILGRACFEMNSFEHFVHLYSFFSACVL